MRMISGIIVETPSPLRSCIVKSLKVYSLKPSLLRREISILDMHAHRSLYSSISLYTLGYCNISHIFQLILSFCFLICQSHFIITYT